MVSERSKHIIGKWRCRTIPPNPFVFESELLSPYFELEPGACCTWQYQWQATNIGGDYAVQDCTEAGVVVQPLKAETSNEPTATHVRLSGRFGVFAPCKIQTTVPERPRFGTRTIRVGTRSLSAGALVLDSTVDCPVGTATVELILVGDVDRPTLRLARQVSPVTPPRAHEPGIRFGKAMAPCLVGEPQHRIVLSPG